MGRRLWASEAGRPEDLAGHEQQEAKKRVLKAEFMSEIEYPLEFQLP